MANQNLLEVYATLGGDPRIPLENVFQDEFFQNPNIEVEVINGMSVTHPVFTEISEATEKVINEGVAPSNLIAKVVTSNAINVTDTLSVDTKAYAGINSTIVNQQITSKMDAKTSNLASTFLKKALNPKLTDKDTLLGTLPKIAGSTLSVTGGTGDKVSAYLISCDTSYGLKFITPANEKMVAQSPIEKARVSANTASGGNGSLTAYVGDTDLYLGLKAESIFAVTRIKGIAKDGSNKDNFIAKLNEAMDNRQITGKYILVCNATTKRMLGDVATDTRIDENGKVTLTVRDYDGVDVVISNYIQKD